MTANTANRLTKRTTEVASNATARPTGESAVSAKKIVIVVLGVVAFLGIAGCTAYAILTQTPTVIIGDGTDVVTLTDGETKIKSGGTYTITGSTANGQLEINTAEEVKIILSNASITNPNGAAIKIKGSGSTTIMLVGENNLTSAESGSDPAAAISADYGLTITSEGGSVKISSNGKGIKAGGALRLESGIFNIDSVDDAIHSNDSAEILDGTYVISTGDDAIHADGDLTISGGVIDVVKSHEGLEAVNLTIADGEISIVADDDGINATNSDGSSMVMRAGDAKLAISGGKVYVNSKGDGLDSNGSIEISGGTIYVDGPTDSANSSVDCDGEIAITGGTLIAVGASGMAQNATSATQPSILISLGGSYSGDLSFGNLTYSPTKSYQAILISSSFLKVGETYTLKINGKEIQSVTISQNIVGQSNGMGGFGSHGGMMDMPAGQNQGKPNQDDRREGVMRGNR